MLVAEPMVHVPSSRFEVIVRSARDAGPNPCGAPAIPLSRSVLLEAAPSWRLPAEAAVSA